MHENGSAASRPAGKNGPDLETRTLHRATRNATASASSVLPPFLETEVKGDVNTRKGSRYSCCIDQGVGKEQSTLGSKTDPGRVTETGYPRVQTNDPEV